MPERYALAYTPAVERSLRRFTRRHPDLARRVAEALRQLERDPRAPALRLHPLTGELSGLHAVWVNYMYRLVLDLDDVAGRMTLHAIGSHGEVYR